MCKQTRGIFCRRGLFVGLVVWLVYAGSIWGQETILTDPLTGRPIGESEVPPPQSDSFIYDPEAEGTSQETSPEAAPPRPAPRSVNPGQRPGQRGGIAIPPPLELTDDPPASVYTLSDAFVDGLENDPRLAVALAEVRSAEERVTQAKSGYLPTVRFTASGGTTEDIRPDVRDGDQYSVGVAVDQSLYSFGRRKHTIRASEAALRAAQFDFNDQQQRILNEIAAAYFGALAAETIYRLYVDHTDTSYELLQSAQERYAADTISGADLRLVLSLYNQSVSDFYQARVQRVFAENNLRRIIGEAEIGQLTLDGVDTVLELLPVSLEAAIDSALQNNPGLIAALFRIREGEELARRSDSELLPELGLQFTSSTGKIEEDPTGSNSLLLNLNSPLFQGGVLRSLRRESQFQVRQREQSALTVRRQIVEQVRNAWSQLRTFEQGYVNLQAALEAERLAIDELEAQAESGTIPIFQVLDARRSSLTIETQEAEYRFDTPAVQFNLLAAVGLLNVETLGLTPSEEVQPPSVAPDALPEPAPEAGVSDDSPAQVESGGS